MTVERSWMINRKQMRVSMTSVLVIEKVVGLDLIESERGGKNKIWYVIELMEQLLGRLIMSWRGITVIF